MLKHQSQTEVRSAPVNSQINPPVNGAPPAASRITLSVQDAVAASGLSRSYLYQAMSEGKLAFVKKGKRRLIPAAALSNYILKSDA